MEKDAGCCATDEYDQEGTIKSASTWKQLWDKELANYVAEKGCNKKLQGKDKQNKYFVFSYYHQYFKKHLLFIPMWSNICNSSLSITSIPSTNFQA